MPDYQPNESSPSGSTPSRSPGGNNPFSLEIEHILELRRRIIAQQQILTERFQQDWQTFEPRSMI